MMGYTEKDILDMIDAINEAHDFMYSPGNTKLRQNLRTAREFLEGLLAEDRI